MNHEQVIQALKNLGFDHGWSVTGTEIVLWEHDEPQPTEQQLKDALK